MAKITVTFVNTPTAYNDPYKVAFGSLEEAVRKIVHANKNYGREQLIAVEEEGVGFHHVFLTEKGEPSLGDWRVPTGGKRHESEAYKAMEAKIREEYAKPKLA